MISRVIRIVLFLPTALAAAASAKVRPFDNLTPEQTRVLAEAVFDHGQDWRFLSKTVDGTPRTVLLIGEKAKSTTQEEIFTKRLVDHFEHYAIHTPHFDGAYESYYDEPHDRAHSRFAPVGAQTKSIHDLGQYHRRTFGETVERFASGVLTGIMSGGSSARSDGDGLIRLPIIAVALVGRLALHMIRFDLPRRKNGVNAIAKFTDEWVLEKPREKMLVAMVIDKYLARVEQKLVRDYGFQTGRVACAGSECRVVLSTGLQ